MSIIDEAAQVVWQPDAKLAQASNLAAFMREFAIEQADAAGYRQLLQAADREPLHFWDRVIGHTGLEFYTPYQQVLDTSKGIEWAQWCVGGTTNAALNCLDRHLRDAPEQKQAVIWEGESGQVKRWSYAELAAQTSRLTEGLRALGCKPGDVVAVLMPMVPEAVAAMLGVVKAGCIGLPLFSGFGTQAIVDRLNDSGAVAVITADGTVRRGKQFALKPAIDAAAPQVPTLKHVLVLRNTGQDVAWDSSRDHWWHEQCDGRSDRAPTEQLPAEAPMLLIYTSGTTGRPKGAVYTHCGFIAKLALDMQLCSDLKSTDRMMWMSDMGWLAGPMLVYGTTLVGGTIVLAEGAPDFPDAGRFWRLIQDHAVSFLGIAPTIIRSFMQVNGAGVESFNLASLRVTLSSGEAWTPSAWTWMFEKVCRKRVPIINFSGGTELGGGIVTGTVLHPMKPCAFSGPVPGMGADVVDEKGQSVGLGGVGELVVRQPSIGMTRGLWKDPKRYIESYWSRFPGMWLNGDRAAIDADGYWYILGRSDDTLKIAGKRTGPSEIESLVAGTGKVAEVAAIGIPDPVKGQSVLLVVVLIAGVAADDTTRKALSDAVVAGLGGPFKPSGIVFVADIPKTRNMKIMRRIVRAVCVGEPPGDLSSLLNPEAVASLGETVRAALTAR